MPAGSRWISHTAALALGAGLGTAGMFAALNHQGEHASHAHYAGQDARQISSLSREDVASLQRGAGWGRAKPAELNGYPGPRHVLDAAEEIGLTATQKQQVEAIFHKMNLAARQLGKEYIGAEAALDAVFAENQADERKLSSALAAAEKLRARLRAIHLSAHLETAPLLDASQKKKYAELRGYGGHANHTKH